MAVFRVEKSKNYTVMSNYHLKDKRLTLKAKGLLSQMLSLPDNWDYTLHGLTCINGEKIDAIRKAITELESHGYILRSRDRNEKGQLTGAIYTIYEEPQAVSENGTAKKPTDSGLSPTADNPTLEKPTLEKPTLEKPTLDNPTLDNPMLGKPTLENPTQLNTNISNPKKQNTDFIKYQSTNHGADGTNTDGGGIDRIETQQQIDSYRELIHENIDYDVMILNNPRDKEYIDELVEIMLECVMSRGYIKIDGQEIAAEIVKSRMLKINCDHIDYVLLCMSENTTKISNIKAYLKTAIYNAPTTINNYFKSRVNHDLSGKGGNYG